MLRSPLRAIDGFVAILLDDVDAIVRGDEREILKLTIAALEFDIERRKFGGAFANPIFKRITPTEPLRTRIDTVIEAKVPIRESLALPISEPVSARLTFPQQQVEAGLDLMDLTVPFDSVSLGLRPRAQP